MTNKILMWFSIILAFQVTIIIITALLSQPTYAIGDTTNRSANIYEGSQAENNITNLSFNKGHSEDPKITVLGNNTYVVWIDDSSGMRDIYFRKSTDKGCNFSPIIDVSNQNGGSVDPHIAASANNIYLIWEHTPGNNGEVFFTRSTDGGETFERSRNMGNNTGFNGYPQIAVMEKNVYLVWHDASHGILFTKSTDNGSTFDSVKNIGGNNSFNGSPQIAVTEQNVYITWINNDRKNYSQIFFTRSTDNGNSFETPVELGKGGDHVTGTLLFNPRIATDLQTHNVHVVWHGGRIAHQGTGNINALISDVLYQRSTDNGQSFGKTINLSNYSGWSTNPQIVVSQNNTVYVVWTNNAQQKYGQIFFTRSTDNGQSFGKTINLSNYSGWSTNPQIVVSQNNTVYVVWTNNAQHQQKYGQIFFTRSTDNGQSFGKTINLSNYSGWSTNPQIAVSQNNSVYVVWTNNATGNEETLFKGYGISNICTTASNYNQSYKNNEIDRSLLKQLNIAFVDPTFTFAAYDSAFYLFYDISNPGHKDSNFTKYTDLLTSRIPGKPYLSKESDDIMLHLKWLLPESNIHFITDQDVHNGSLIFNDKDVNLYDVLILSHQEYVTQREYDNLKKFVANGGILILLDGNVFYAEVRYDEITDKITLVKGHGWAFDGKSAWKSIEERWEDETSQWIGSNYLCCFDDDIIFNNNPFDIKHDEEQYITNPHAKILLDYNATENEPNPRKFTIATYEFDYKRGKVLTMGLYTDDLKANERFWRFFDSLIFQYILAQKVHS
jgi:glutaredoxin-related protein